MEYINYYMDSISVKHLLIIHIYFQSSSFVNHAPVSRDITPVNASFAVAGSGLTTPGKAVRVDGLPTVVSIVI